MKNWKSYLIGALAMLLLIWLYNTYRHSNEQHNQLISETALIQKQLKNVSKLIVTEMTYAKVYTYENTQSYGWDFFSSQKRALIISNATAQITYDLKQLSHELDPAHKTLYITYIPKPELNIDPNLTFYQLDNGVLNRFEAKDINSIKDQILKDLRSKISQDAVMDNAQNRLLTELSSMYLLSSSMGWKLVYNDIEVNSTKEMNSLLF